MTRTIPIEISGREASEPELPALLGGASRGVGAQPDPDPFLPKKYLEPKATFDVGTTARSAKGAVLEVHLAQADEIVVLEMADGSTLITSAERLQDALRRTHPDWLKADGTIPFEKLRAAGAAPGRGLGEALGGLVSKVFTLIVKPDGDPIIDAAIDYLKKKKIDKAQLGITWAGTKALMWAIEERLERKPGLYRWNGASDKLEALEPSVIDKAAANKEPMLVFVHGTASSSMGSFGDLRAGDRELWSTLESHFTGGIFAFEHRTLSESPIENALQLAAALPKGACISLVTHSRGGLVADLLCLGDFNAQIDAFRRPANLPGLGDEDPESAAAMAVVAQLRDAHAGQRAQLHELLAALRDKQLTVQRYVRTASPANGTKLASGNFDLFLSGLLTLIGQVPFFFGSPFYAAFKRVVIEIARNRTKAHLVPGIEAMLPDAPMARLLRDAPVRPGLAMSVIAGDMQGGNMLKRLGLLLTDFLFFENEDNDLVVNTTAMLAGIAPRAGCRVLFDRGADVSHFRYFSNIGTRSALRDWLICPVPAELSGFRPLPAPEDFAFELAAAARDAAAADRPVVVVLPGVMGSHLWVGAKDRIWFDVTTIARGGLDKIAWDRAGVEAEDLFGRAYGELCNELAKSHRVERFPYDWRQPLDVLAERLGEFLDRLMKQTQQPIRLLAHSMGGLVVRACIHKRRPVMNALMARAGARLVMLGTPNQGAHSMVENLIGKGDMLRMLVRLDLKHDMQQVLDIVAGFRGALQLLPKPGFKDVFQGQPDGGEIHDYQQAPTWAGFKGKVKDFWFGNGRVAQPLQPVLDSAAWLWTQDGPARPSLPAEYEKHSVYVFGVARNTSCGVRELGGQLKLVGTSHGDGTVSWESGRIGGIGQFFYMQAEHGDLLSTREHFPALIDLLISGNTSRLPTTPPATRAIAQPTPVSYDAGPPTADDPDVLIRSLLGGSPSNRVPPRRKRRLEVRVRAMDLRFLVQPVLVGHYERDPIAGPQRLIDRELLEGDLSERHSLGLYPGPLGTATVVLRKPNEAERRRASLTGAVVTGLGRYDGALSPNNLAEAVRAGVVRYLLQVIDVLGKEERELSLATLLLGYNSSANLSVEASVEALLRGVMEGNARFYETTRLNIRITRLDIVELYIDTAITAVYALRQLETRLAAQAEQQHTLLVCNPALERGEGMRQRLFDNRDANYYWPRMIVTDAAEGKNRPAPAAEQQRAAAEPFDAPATALADTLQFLFVGQRARAEAKLQQRQPGLIEQLVHEQIGNPVWSEDFGRMLFQLMVPHDFKDAARELQRMVLVVDSTTANLPWELMLADDPMRGEGDRLPLALRTAVVRQLTSTRFRRHVRQSIARSALVIGNPSVEGFAKAFSLEQGKTESDLNLPGAQAEAEAVTRLLGGMGYKVESVIKTPASTVLAALYQQPWRILHISAHGVFGLRHSDGRYRSGVLLSGGLLITAAEIAAMEVVPDVVFLNCCHLGTVDVGRQGNKLAASVSRELIDIGVRCVVVAGWAVDDRGAQVFGESFYEELLLRRRPFGSAVFEARKAVWAENPRDITWGAFQAYGDPAWRAEPRAEGDAEADLSPYVSPEELLDALARIRADLSRRSDRQRERELPAKVADLEKVLKTRCQPAWLEAPAVLSALGATWFELKDLERARKALAHAVRVEDKEGTVPIHDIERLANVEARLGERRAQSEVRIELAGNGKKKDRGASVEGTTEADQHESSEKLILRAIKRLQELNALVAPEAGAARNIERSALLGGAFKRMANLYARRVLAAERIRHDEARSARDLKKADKLAAAASLEMRKMLQQSIAAYRRDEGSPEGLYFSGYLALNRLALDALTPWPQPAEGARAIELARHCAAHAERAFAHSANVWDAVTAAEALLVEKLLDRSLGKSEEAGHAVTAAYDQAFANVGIKPSELDSVVSQMELLSRFFDVLALAPNEPDAALYRGASGRLLELRQRLVPGIPPRDDLPLPPPKPARPATARKRAARQRPARS